MRPLPAGLAHAEQLAHAPGNRAQAHTDLIARIEVRRKPQIGQPTNNQPTQTTQKERSMPFIDIKVIEGVFTPEEKRELVERVSENAIAVEGEALRPFTVTAITETPSGEWAVGGQTYTADDVKAARSAAAIA
jgi:4-oxalocrotonate tautomerase